MRVCCGTCSGAPLSPGATREEIPSHLRSPSGVSSGVSSGEGGEGGEGGLTEESRMIIEGRALR